MWPELIKDSFMRPREAARRVMALNLPMDSLIEAAIAVTCLGLVLGHVAMFFAPTSVDSVTGAILHRPLVGAVVQLATLAIAVALTVQIGRALGGTGDLHNALALIVWLNAVMLLVQIAQLVAMAIWPFFGLLLAFASMFWVIWAFANFVTELHGFSSPVKVLGGVIMTAILVFVVLSIVIGALGLGPDGVA